MNRSVTAYAENANDVAAVLGGIVNGISWKGLDGRDRVVVTVLDRETTLKNTKGFKLCKKNGWLVSWALA